MSRSYKERSDGNETGKWLTRFFGLSFLAAEEVGDSFAVDIMGDMPDSPLCETFSIYYCAWILLSIAQLGYKFHPKT